MIAGAISHIALAGGWFARKSPPYTVSSKCSQVESPSPFVLTAPLIPPCAQTECERFTGTTESRSTSCPASAIFIVAASPANPPPTTTILIPLAIVFCGTDFSLWLLTPPHRLKVCATSINLQNSGQQAARTNERHRGVDADRQQHYAESQTSVTGDLLGALADSNYPINQK